MEYVIVAQCCVESQLDKKTTDLFFSEQVLTRLFFLSLRAVMQRKLEYITNSSQTKFFFPTTRNAEESCLLKYQTNRQKVNRRTNLNEINMERAAFVQIEITSSNSISNNAHEKGLQYGESERKRVRSYEADDSESEAFFLFHFLTFHGEFCREHNHIGMRKR